MSTLGLRAQGTGGLYTVQEGYIDVQEGCILFRGVICCSGGLYVEENNNVQSGH